MQIIYKLDPRTKILLVLLFTTLVFLVNVLSVTAGLLFVVLFFRIAGRIPFKSIKSFIILTMLVIFMIIIQILFGPGENYIVKPLFPHTFPFLGGMGALKWDGLITGLVIGCRLAALMLILPMFTETTAPEQIACGLAALGFNYRVSFIITTAFNLIPLFEEEGRAIIDAQKMRGLRFLEEGSFFTRLKVYPGLVVPLVLGAMRKAQSASAAMDSRAFGVYKSRTWLEKPAMKVRDYTALSVCFVFSALTLFLNYMLK